MDLLFYQIRRLSGQWALTERSAKRPTQQHSRLSNPLKQKVSFNKIISGFWIETQRRSFCPIAFRGETQIQIVQMMKV